MGIVKGEKLLTRLKPRALAALPSAVGLRTGTAYEITDYGGNVAVAVNGVWRFEFPFRTTWAGRPPVNLVSPGTELQATDYNSQKWICDGSAWWPAQGRIRIKGGTGNPLAVLSGVASGLFTLPQIKVPVGMFFEGAIIRVESLMKKTTGTASYSFMAYVGPAGTTSDPNIGITSVSANAGACVRLSSIAVVTADSLIGSRYTGPHGYDNGAATVSAISMSSDLLVTLGVGFANAADIFHLQQYQVTLEV